MMTWNYGPERAEAIRALQAQIAEAKSRLRTIDATADDREVALRILREDAGA